MSTLAGKTILVTGASRGIGAATAKACRKAGARVLEHASARSAAQARDDLLIADLGAPGAGEALVAAAVAKAGRLDGIVNNAGIYIPSALGDEESWMRGWEATLAVNLRAPADICRAAIAHFREKGGGRIVNVASRAGQRGDGVDHSAYAASKGGLIALTKTFARALAGENILFYCVAPGWVETRMAPEDIEARERAVADIPLGRVAQPDEIGALIAFLLSDLCPSATGSTFDVNGASYVR